MSSPYDVVGFSDPGPLDPDDLPGPVGGVVLDADRGSLPFRLVHGESLVAAAAWALGAAGVDLLDLTVPWTALAERGEALVLHDPLCPLTPPGFIAACVNRAFEEDRAVVGVRPVVDTVKRVDEDPDGTAVLGATVDRDALVAICSPLVLAPRLVEELLGDGSPLPSTDLAVLVGALRDRFGDDAVVLAEAPAQARRVAGDDDIVVLEALTDPRR